MLLALFALHLAVQGGPPAQRAQQTAVRDSTPADSLTRRTPRRLPVTAAVLASAFHDAATRDLFDRARRARMSQDSSLKSYDAKVKQRMSVMLGIGKFGRERLVFRQESASRVQWQRGTGVRIDVTGARVAIPPIHSTKEERDAAQSSIADMDMSPIPYYPGSESLWIGGGAARTEVDERNLVNPIAVGAEAYYTYATGDSVSFRLPGGRVIQLRELKVRPRSPKFNLAVGSLWFDTESGQLVRAAYRLAAPAHAAIGVNSNDSSARPSRVASAMLSALLSPNKAEVSAIVVEYGLYEGRFWLPRIQSAEASLQAMFARVPVKYENAISYASVNGTLDLPSINVDTTLTLEGPRLQPPPELGPDARQKWRDSTRALYAVARKARGDSVRAGLTVGSMRQCDTSSTRVITRYRFDTRLPVELRIPCDIEQLTNSPDLPASIYDANEEVFGAEDRDRLIADALSMGAQAPIAFGMLPPTRLQFGLSMTRYNRVEGFSTGLGVEQQLGGGYVAAALARFGAADREPNAELSLARTNLTTTVRLNGYNRLVSASDWGNPLSFGSSVSAFLFGRDDGFYYRASGAELLWTTERGIRLDWRAFAEQQRSAKQETSFSLGANFTPNIDAARGTSAGAAVRFLHTLGLDPRGFRMFTDLRLEAAGGDSTYGRGALDITVSRDLGDRYAAALTAAGGTTVGGVPPQRRWFLGGTETIRGQKPDTAQSGNAFWLSRLELARNDVGVRTSLFGDIGWVGDRTQVSDVGRPMSGVGIGLSGLDGLIRLDIARGLYPRKQTRVNLYLDARF
jgi:hypothetical protein